MADLEDEAADLAEAVARRQSSAQLGLVASGAAFWLVISAFPTGIAVVNLYGLIVDPKQVARDLGRLVHAAPGSLGLLLGAQLQHVAAADRAGLTLGLVVSVVLALWSASAGMYYLDAAIRDAFGLPQQRYLEARARSFAEAALAVVALGAIALTFGAAIAHLPGWLAVAIGLPSVFVGVVVALVGLYRFAVGQPMRLRSLIPGATSAAAGMLAVVVGLGIYASVSTHFAAVYGAFGATAIAMIGAYLGVYVVLLGAATNAELHRADTGGARSKIGRVGEI